MQIKKFKTTLVHVVLAASLPVFAGCATNPVTGRQDFNLVSNEQELAIGEQNYAPAQQMQGARYNADPGVEAYVSRVGQKLAAASDRDLNYEFVVLNNSVPNAWAMPGGKIAINRGLLVELDSEAELAAVLGHEITHAAARHTARSMSKGTLLQGGIILAAIAGGRAGQGELAVLGSQVAAQLVNQKYSRESELESDYYGMEYMRRAGYDAAAAISLQQKFVKLAEGHSQNWLSGLFASHPPSVERVERNRERAAELGAGGFTGEAEYASAMSRLKATRGAYEAYDEAEKVIQEDQDYTRANTLVERALDIEPEEGLFYALKGDIELHDGDHEAAERWYSRAIEKNDKVFYFPLMRGAARDEAGRLEPARLDVERSMELLPTAQGSYLLGSIARKRGDTRAAVDHFKRAAGASGPTGEAAYRALFELDLERNPAQYLPARVGVDRSGYVVVQVTNPSPVAVRGVAVEIAYRDSAGQPRAVTRSHGGTIGGGQKVLVSTGLGPVTGSGSLDSVQARVVTAVPVQP